MRILETVLTLFNSRRHKTFYLIVFLAKEKPKSVRSDEFQELEIAHNQRGASILATDVACDTRRGRGV